MTQRVSVGDRTSAIRLSATRQNFIANFEHFTSQPSLTLPIESSPARTTPRKPPTMAHKQPFKIHSLSKHIENTKKGLSAESQFNRRPAGRAPAVKKDPDSFNPNNLFKSTGDDDDEEASSDSDSSSDGEGGSDFLRKLGAPDVKTPTPASRRRNKDVEIADSDVERNASSKNTTAAKKSAKVKPEAVSSDDTSSSSDTSSDSESDSEAATKPTKPAAAKEASSDSSSEESSSSDSESESEAEPETKAKAKPVVNGKATTATTSSSSSEESSSESESEDEPAKPVKPTKKPVETEADSSSSSEDEDEEMADESMHIEDRQDKRQLAAVPNFIAPDFVLRKGDDGVNGKDVAEICNQANLEGKQFWYFTVPSNVPISVVQNLEIPMDHSQRGNPLFSHGGDDYGVSFESIAPKGNIQILIPSADGSQYRSCKFFAPSVF